MSDTTQVFARVQDVVRGIIPQTPNTLRTPSRGAELEVPHCGQLRLGNCHQDDRLTS